LPEHPSSKPSTGSQPAPVREPAYAPPISFHGPLPPPPPVSYRPAPYAGEAFVCYTHSALFVTSTEEERKKNKLQDENIMACPIL